MQSAALATPQAGDLGFVDWLFWLTCLQGPQ